MPCEASSPGNPLGKQLMDPAMLITSICAVTGWASHQVVPSAGWRQQPAPAVHCSLREDTRFSSSSSLLRSSLMSGAGAQPQAWRGMLIRCVKTIWFPPSMVCSWKLSLGCEGGAKSFSPLADSRSTEHWDPTGSLML